jgi:DNA-binding MarR family transcriptional regulator
LKRKPVAIPQLIAVQDVPVHPALKMFTGYCVNKAAIRIKTIQQEKLNKYKIIPAQMGIMRLLQIEGPLSQISLGQSIGIDKATMVKLIDDLENKKWLERTTSTSDRRIKHIRLTKKGHDFLGVMSDLCKEAEVEFLHKLTAKEQQQFIDLLQKLL